MRICTLVQWVIQCQYWAHLYFQSNTLSTKQQQQQQPLLFRCGELVNLDFGELRANKQRRLDGSSSSGKEGYELCPTSLQCIQLFNVG